MQVSATFYQANAAAGSAGFKATVGGPMGRWRDTPPGHHSVFELMGCSNEDRSCVTFIAASYGIHPGGSYGSVLKGTWVAPAGGKWLLRVVANCDVVFYSDVEAEGCHVDDGSGGCQATADGTDNSECASTLQVTVTPDAYFDDDSSNADGQQQSGGASDDRGGPVAGSAERTDTIVLSRADVEAQAAAVFDATPAAERTLAAPPTLEEMLVGGSEANALLTSMLTVQQQPHVVYPLTIEAVASAGGGGGGSGHHHRRQLQGAEPEPEPEGGDVAGVRASLKIRAPTSGHAAALAGAKTPFFWRRFLIKIPFLPRQARDNRKEKWSNTCFFL